MAVLIQIIFILSLSPLFTHSLHKDDLSYLEALGMIKAPIST
jgi:hypothetical protein